MIGQKEVLKQVDNLIEKGFPRFTVIIGQRGQGKTKLAKYIMYKLDNYYKDELADKGGCYMIEVGTKIDEIREMIQMAYKQTEPIIYLIQNADKMSIGAKNSLLKVIEEPPNNAYFIMELQQIENTLDTIKSRCQEIKMENYKENEIEEMIRYNIEKNKYTITEDEYRMLKQAAQNYYQICKLLVYGIMEIYNYVDKVYNNIYKVQSANSFKIAEKIDLKDTGEGYDLEMFWNIYIYRCIGELFDLMAIPADENDWAEADIVGKCINITEKYKQKLNISGINKQSLIDMWILDIRKEWRR